MHYIITALVWLAGSIFYLGITATTIALIFYLFQVLSLFLVLKFMEPDDADFHKALGIKNLFYIFSIIIGIFIVLMLLMMGSAETRGVSTLPNDPLMAGIVLLLLIFGPFLALEAFLISYMFSGGFLRGAGIAIIDFLFYLTFMGLLGWILYVIPRPVMHKAIDWVGGRMMVEKSDRVPDIYVQIWMMAQKGELGQFDPDEDEFPPPDRRRPRTQDRPEEPAPRVEEPIPSSTQRSSDNSDLTPEEREALVAAEARARRAAQNEAQLELIRQRQRELRERGELVREQR